MVAKAWAPDAGELIWLYFDPQAGHEQAGHRPAVVLSPAGYNRKTGLLLCVPLTTRIKGFPFEVPIAGSRPSVAMADQVKSLDWRARRATPNGRVSDAELKTVRSRVRALVG